MQLTAMDNRVFLKDSPSYWRRPSFIKVDSGSSVSMEIYYPIFYGQDVPTKIFPVVTRGTMKLTENSDVYFVGVLCILNRPLQAITYPPTSTNQVDAIGMFDGKIKEMKYIDADAYALNWYDYKALVPQEVIDTFVLHGGNWA